MKTRRISFTDYDIAHLYELSVENFQVFENGCCPQCKLIKDRIEKFLGEKEVNKIKKVVKKYPYEKHTN